MKREGKTRPAKLDAGKFGPWAVVTGASSGIGREAAHQLAANRLNLVLVSRRKEVLESLGEELRERFGIDFRVIEADLSNPEGQQRVARETAHLDVGLLFSNAGMGQPGNFLAFEEEDLRRVAQLNGVSYMYLSHVFGRRMAERGRGGIVLVSALGADTGVPYNTKEAASKAMVSTLGKCLHHEFAPLGINVSVLVVTPTETPIIEKMGLQRRDMPMAPMPVDKCVRAGLEGVGANTLMVVPGLMFKLMIPLMPGGLVRKMTANMMKKSTQFVT